MKKNKRVRVVFDFEDGEMKIWGPDNASRQDTLAQLQDGGLLIPSGQRVHFEVDDDDGDEATFQFDKRDNLKIEAPLSMMMLKVTCTDDAGNSSEATAAPTFVADDDEEEEEEEEEEED